MGGEKKKSVAAIVKGAVAGPYGAAEILWTNRKTVIKIILALAFLLLLPVLFILMLPGLVFGGFDAGSLTDSSQPSILNNDTAIVENVNKLSFTISEIMGEGLEDVLERIEEDFRASGGDKKEIINPYARNLTYNTNLIISQYCAVRNQNYQSITAVDMKKIMRCARQHLYSFTRTEKEREAASVDPKTGVETTITELWMIYTVVYNGEDYFADHIFKLSGEQKELAGDYAYNLSVYMDDGLFQRLDDEFIHVPSYEGVIFADGSTPVAYFNQLDERFKDKPYGTDYIGGYGCGPTSMSIVVSTLTDKTVDPIQMAEWSYKNGYWCSKSGSYHALIPGAAKAWNLPVEGCTTSNPQRIVNALSSGKLVVAIMSKGHFTSSGHFIVLRGVTSEGRILVADPASYLRSQKEWDISIILKEASKRVGAGGPYWIIG